MVAAASDILKMGHAVAPHPGTISSGVGAGHLPFPGRDADGDRNGRFQLSLKSIWT